MTQVRFTQRQLRETLCWSDRSLRRQLSRLVELEYVLAYRTGRGNGRAYQLLYDPATSRGAAAAWQLGLVRRGEAPRHASHASRVLDLPPKE